MIQFFKINKKPIIRGSIALLVVIVYFIVARSLLSIQPVEYVEALKELELQQKRDKESLIETIDSTYSIIIEQKKDIKVLKAEIQKQKRLILKINNNK